MVYGFYICATRPGGEFRFWKQGYWAQVLGEDLKYHISALPCGWIGPLKTQAGGIRMLPKALVRPGSKLIQLGPGLAQQLAGSDRSAVALQDWLWCGAR